MKAYHFKIEYEDYSAELVMGGEWSLYELAEICIEAVGFDFDHAFEFCGDIRNPHRSQERYSIFSDMDEGEEDDCPGVKGTLVSSVFRKGKRMALHFDFGDDWFFLVSCTGVLETAAKRRSRKILSNTGTPPVQYPGNEDDVDD